MNFDDISRDPAEMRNGKASTPKHSAVQHLQRERREKKPFFYCRWVSNHPWKIFAVTLSLHVLMVIITGVLIATGMDVFPLDFDGLPIQLYSVPHRNRDNAWRGRNNYNNRFTRVLSDVGLARFERGLFDGYASVDLYYDTEDGNIFTKNHLLKIQSIENDLQLSMGYKSEMCMTQNESLACKPFKSIVQYFDGSLKYVDAIFDDRSFDNIPTVLYNAYTNNLTTKDFMYFLPKDFSISPNEVKGTLTRSIMRFGCSLNGDTKCNTGSWRKKTRDFCMDNLVDKLKQHVEDVTEFQFYFNSFGLWISIVQKQAILDLMCAIGSMLFIFCFMIFHTHSLWITGWSVLSILTSFIGTNLIYVGVIGFKYLGFFHVLSIFIILGIGADNLFVFYDIWRLTAYSSYPSLAHRLSDAYSKSVISMLMTSLTTAVAFCSSAISPLLATRSFGIFSGMLVMYNYCSVIIFFPNVVILYHKYFENWMWPCFRCCNKESGINSNIDNESNNKVQFAKDNEGFSISREGDHRESLSTGYRTVIHVRNDNRASDKPDLYTASPNGNTIQYFKPDVSNGSVVGSHSVEYENQVYEQRDHGIDSPNVPKETQKKHHRHQKKLVVFFRDYYFRFITNTVTRIIVLPLFVGVIAFFSYKASQLEPDNEELKIFRESHYLSRSVKSDLYQFEESDSSSLVTVYIAWGLGEKDRSNCHFSDKEEICIGKQVFDDSFNPNPPANQLAMKRFCENLRSLSSSKGEELKIRKDQNGRPEIACFATHLDTYLQSLSVDNQNWSMPWDYEKTLNFMKAQPLFYNASRFNTSFTDWLEIPMQYWMYNGYTGVFSRDYAMFNNLFGEQTTSFSSPLEANKYIYYGNRLKYIGVAINTTINRRITSYSSGIPIANKWEEFVNSEMSNMPTGVNNAFQFTLGAWHWFYVQKTLADNAMLGIVIGISLSFVILTLTTMNIVIGLFATISICCTTVCVVGVIPLAGWKLGLLVSLNMCLLVGLAVDYVVHLAEGYHLSLHKDRLNRTRDMLEEMGMAVFSGACTTLGASLFMFLAEVQFFMQFGIFLFCTIGFSIFFALGLFTMLMSLLGPENNVGDLRTLFRLCMNKCKK